MRLFALASLGAILPIILLTGGSEPDRKNRPNIVMIVLDDAGYSDLGALGSEIATPHIDRLAEAGVLFSQFHVTPNCSSTRASLLTGMDHHRTGLGTHGTTAKSQVGKPGYEGFLNDRVVTVAEVLRDAGYRTMGAGKWHLASRDPGTWPKGRGFDHSFALLNGGASHWDDSPLFPSKPSIFVEDGKLVEKFPENFYSSDYFTSKIIDYLGVSEKPFFAFLSFTAPHNPLHAPAELTEKYEKVYTDGWDALHLRRLAALKSHGLIEADVQPQPRPDWIPAWDSLDEEAKKTAARDMAVYAAMIDRLDENVGRLVARLKELGKYNNTLFLVFSDNGPSRTTIADYLAIDGVASDFIEQFDNSLANRGLPGSNIDIGPGWAYGLAAPFRLMKGYQSQGGVLSPLIVKPPVGWSKATELVDAPVHVMDIMPTLLEVAGADHPGGDSLPMQGRSLAALVKGADGAAFEERGFGGELFGIRAYRLGNWKIFMAPTPYGTGQWQLYDLSADPGETIDLATEQPDRLQDLAERWGAYAAANGVVEPEVATFYAKPPKPLGDSGKSK